MPYISVDVQHVPNLIEASLTLSFTQLTDILKLVVDQSNQHDAQINELKAQLQEQRRLTMDLQSKLDTVTAQRNDARSVQALGDDLSSLRGAVSSLTQRVGDIDHNLRSDVDGISKRLTKESQSTSVAFSEQSDKIHALGKQLGAEMEPCRLFVEMWGGPRVSDMKELVQPGRSQEERTAFVHTLPPMQLLAQARKHSAVAGDDNDQNGENAYVRRRELRPEVLGILRPDLDATNDRLGNTEGNLKAFSRETADQLGHLDERARLLDATKADHISMNEKADKGQIQALGQRLDGLLDDIGGIHDRLAAVEANGAGNAAAAGRKKSLPTIGVVPSEAESLRKRVAVLETEAARLEDKKADKTQLQKLYEALDTLGTRRPSTQNSPVQGQGEQNLTPLKAAPPPHRNSLPASNSPSYGIPEGELGVGGPGRLGGVSPRRVSSARPVFLGRSIVSVRDSSGSITPASLGCVTGR